MRPYTVPVKISAIDSAFERALSAEIAASELLRVRVLAVTLAGGGSARLAGGAAAAGRVWGRGGA